MVLWSILLLILVVLRVQAANVTFTNCLGTVRNSPYFTPTDAQAFFENPAGTDSNILRFQIWGNVNNGTLVDLDSTTNTYSECLDVRIVFDNLLTIL